MSTKKKASATSSQLKGTPQEYVQALGNAPVKVFTLYPGEKVGIRFAPGAVQVLED